MTPRAARTTPRGDRAEHRRGVRERNAVAARTCRGNRKEERRRLHLVHQFFQDVLAPPAGGESGCSTAAVSSDTNGESRGLEELRQDFERRMESDREAAACLDEGFGLFGRAV